MGRNYYTGAARSVNAADCFGESFMPLATIEPETAAENGPVVGAEQNSLCSPHHRVYLANNAIKVPTMHRMPQTIRAICQRCKRRFSVEG